ncbi:hypothetical protein EXIGLDRAFT_481179 [Exidia glandulosa HHB12029]|uniref:SET domain-containing protein n=1 Tax=Exidia glandulosa HHB12029 TaxID=1314781 RepID=A0A166NFY4_EXIGL|nr:hypothetical protein EXIGLDRAFT_481179 [Exidia glandulosa HHB12029]
MRSRPSPTLVRAAGIEELCRSQPALLTPHFASYPHHIARQTSPTMPTVRRRRDHAKRVPDGGNAIPLPTDVDTMPTVLRRRHHAKRVPDGVNAIPLPTGIDRGWTLPPLPQTVNTNIGFPPGVSAVATYATPSRPPAPAPRPQLPHLRPYILASHVPNVIWLSRPDGDIQIRPSPGRVATCLRFASPDANDASIRCALDGGAMTGDVLHVERCLAYAPQCHVGVPDTVAETHLQRMLALGTPTSYAPFSGSPHRSLTDAFRSGSVPCLLFAAEGYNVAVDGLFAVASRIPHSCVPNAKLRWDADARALELVAIRSIVVDEEITVSRLPQVLLLAPARERQAWLKRELDIDCVCPSCTLPAPSNSRRTAIAQHSTTIAVALIADLQNPHYTSEGLMLELDETAWEIVALCEEEGLHFRLVLPHIALARKLADRLDSFGDTSRAISWDRVARAEASAFDDTDDFTLFGASASIPVFANPPAVPTKRKKPLRYTL